MIYKTVVTWPNGGQGWFYTDALNTFEAETIVNFLLQRDYHWEGTKMDTKPNPPLEFGELEFDEIYYLNGFLIKSRPATSYNEDYET